MNTIKVKLFQNNDPNWKDVISWGNSTGLGKRKHMPLISDRKANNQDNTCGIYLISQKTDKWK